MGSLTKPIWKIRFSKYQVTRPILACSSSFRINHIRLTLRQTVLLRSMKHRIDRHCKTSIQKREK